MTHRHLRTATRAGLVALVLATGIVLYTPTDAHAGGANWYFDRPSYEPGDVVIATTPVTWGHNPQLGTPEDGPYGAWIEEMPGPEAPPSTLAERVEFARYMTDVAIEAPPAVDGQQPGGGKARVEFVLPDVPPGFYMLLHCNYPCTTQLGDITGGAFWVGPPDPFRPTSGFAAATPPPPSTSVTPTTTPATTAPPTTVPERALAAAAPRPAATNPSRSLTVPLVAGGAVALFAVGGATMVVRRRHGGLHPE